MQLAKAEAEMLVVLLPIVSSFIDVSPLKQVLMFLQSIDRVANLAQLAKTLLPIVVTLLGIITDVSFVLLLYALAPIVVTVLGIVISIKPHP